MIDWDDLLEGYNHQFGTDLDLKGMLLHCHEREGSGLNMQDALGVSHTVIWETMKKLGIKFPKAKKDHSRIVKKLLAIDPDERANMTAQELAERIGCSYHCLLQRVRIMGIKIRYKKATAVKSGLLDIDPKTRANMTAQELAERIGCSKNVVWNRSKAMGIEIRRTKVRHA